MHAISSIASLTAHVALGAAIVLGTAKTGRSGTVADRHVTMVFQPGITSTRESGVSVPALRGPVNPDIPFIPVPATLLHIGAATHQSFTPYAPSAPSAPSEGAASGGSDGSWAVPFRQEAPEVLAGPLPIYPELLRQAGIEGHVVLEAVVDTNGRVEPASLLVRAATNPRFVGPARHALLATLFRPARAGGRAVRMRVRLPFAFTMRSGTGRAR